MSGHDALIDPDCPCCQMLAEMPGPAFWHLDGSGMDDEFAFDIHSKSREEWEQERRRRVEHERQFDAKWSERERLGITNPTHLKDGSSSLWSRSVSVGDTADVPLGIRVFGVGCQRAEIILIFSQLNVFRLRLASNQNAVDLGAPRPERAAQLDNLPARASGKADLDTVPELEELETTIWADSVQRSRQNSWNAKRPISRIEPGKVK